MYVCLCCFFVFVFFILSLQYSCCLVTIKLYFVRKTGGYPDDDFRKKSIHVGLYPVDMNIALMGVYLRNNSKRLTSLPIHVPIPWLMIQRRTSPKVPSPYRPHALFPECSCCAVYTFNMHRRYSFSTSRPV